MYKKKNDVEDCISLVNGIIKDSSGVMASQVAKDSFRVVQALLWS